MSTDDKIQIRAVCAADAAQIALIYNHYVSNTAVTFEVEPLTTEQMLDRIDSIKAHYPYYVCMVDDKIAGYSYAHLWKERAAFGLTLETTIYTAPGYEHRGIGRELMLRVIADCRRMGYHRLVACITAENTASIAFHERLGYRRASHFIEVGHKFGRWWGVVDMEYAL